MNGLILVLMLNVCYLDVILIFSWWLLGGYYSLPSGCCWLLLVTWWLLVVVTGGCCALPLFTALLRFIPTTLVIVLTFDVLYIQLLFVLLNTTNILKFASAIFYQIFISHQMIALQNLWKMFFNSSKKLFSLLKYSDCCISVFSSFSPVRHYFRGWSKINLEVYDIINCLNKNLKKGMLLKLCLLIEY